MYVSVLGLTLYNTFTVIIWDMIFEEDLVTVYVPEGVLVSNVFDLTSTLLTTNITCVTVLLTS